jgi:hypothetical protein
LYCFNVLAVSFIFPNFYQLFFLNEKSFLSHAAHIVTAAAYIAQDKKSCCTWSTIAVPRYTVYYISESKPVILNMLRLFIHAQLLLFDLALYPNIVIRRLEISGHAGLGK